MGIGQWHGNPMLESTLILYARVDFIPQSGTKNLASEGFSRQRLRKIIQIFYVWQNYFAFGKLSTGGGDEYTVRKSDDIARC